MSLLSLSITKVQKYSFTSDKREQKMRIHYLKEYKSTSSEVYEFSLLNIVKCIQKD